MTSLGIKTFFRTSNWLLVLLALQCSSCAGQVKGKSGHDNPGKEVAPPLLVLTQNTTFPQIHTNLNGMVREFVRTMYQDKKGNYWFGTNGNGIIRYDGQTLQKFQSKDSAH